MKFIFADAFLRHDANTYVPRAMILAMEQFKSDNWSIRNSALMCFTACIKRLLDTQMIQSQDLGKKRGFSIIELLTVHKDLSAYFMKKLAECTEKAQGSEMDKQNMIIFSIMLVITRLVPYSFSSGSDHRSAKFESKEFQDTLKSLIEQVASYSSSGTYFVRKISA